MPLSEKDSRILDKCLRQIVIDNGLADSRDPDNTLEFTATELFEGAVVEGGGGGGSPLDDVMEVVDGDTIEVDPAITSFEVAGALTAATLGANSAVVNDSITTDTITARVMTSTVDIIANGVACNRVTLAGTASILAGDYDPEGVQPGTIGSLFIRTEAGFIGLYLKNTPSGVTGWVQV